MNVEPKYVRGLGRDQDEVYGIILPYGFSLSEGIQFFTPQDSPIQLGYMARNEGYEVEPHNHKPVISLRPVSPSQEVLFIRRGILEVDFFDRNDQLITTETIASGDVVMFVQGGHGVRVLKEAEILEVKQGPYRGREGDKIPIPQPNKLKIS